jgi:hypothetical protein
MESQPEVNVYSNRDKLSSALLRLSARQPVLRSGGVGTEVISCSFLSEEGHYFGYTIRP